MSSHVLLSECTTTQSGVLVRAHGECGGDLAGGTLLYRLDDLSDGRQVALDTANDLVIDVLEVVECHPLLTQVLPQRLRVEGELHEDVHLGGLLADDKLTVVGRGQLVQAEEAQIGKNLVECAVVTVRASRVTLEENTGENLNRHKNKWLVTFIKRPKIDHQTS